MATSQQKFSKEAAGFWKKTKTGAARVKQKAMVKMGKSEETVDITYSQEKERFFEHYKALQTFSKDITKYLELLQKLSVQQSTLATHFYELYESKASLYNASLKNQDIAKLNDNARLTLDELFRANMTDPIAKYLGQFAELKDRIEVRSRYRVDMDRYSRDVKIHTEKFNQQRLQATELKLDAAKYNYNTLNEELLQDLPALYEDRISFADPLLATYATGMAEFYRQCAKNSAELLGLVSHVNRDASQTHARVVTDGESSAANPKNKRVPNVAGTGTTTFGESRAASTPTSGSASSSPASTTAALGATTAATTAATTTVNQAAAQTRTMPTPPVKPGAAKSAIRAKALFEFQAQDDTELPFQVEDILIIHTQSGEWWEAEKDGRRGLIPSNYVQLL